MMARSTRGSNQRPDTLMQDRTSANSMKVLLQRTAGPYIWVKLDRIGRGDTPINVRSAPKADIPFTRWHVCFVPGTDFQRQSSQTVRGTLVGCAHNAFRGHHHETSQPSISLSDWRCRSFYSSRTDRCVVANCENCQDCRSIPGWRHRRHPCSYSG